MKHLSISKYRGSIVHNESYEGERIETKIERILQSNEPIKDGAPLIFTERKDGVKPEYNIRTDRFEMAIDAMDVVARTQRGIRDSKIVPLNAGESNDVGDGGAESIQGTNSEKK